MTQTKTLQTVETQKSILDLAPFGPKEKLKNNYNIKV